jgi:hypothetical protein
MPTTNDNVTRWTVSVSKDTDMALRCFLAQRGMKKGDMSKFIEEAVKWQVFRQTLEEVRQGIADIPDAELEAMINEATDSIRAELREEFSRIHA